MGRPNKQVLDDGVPQWKSWYRWPFLALSISGAVMAIYGVQQCIMLWNAINGGDQTIVVESAMSAFPPLGVAIMAVGAMAWLPRKADGSGIRPITMRDGKERDPAKIVVTIILVGLLLYPICGVALRVFTAHVLTARGYTATTERVSGSSGYLTTRWLRKS